MTKLNYVPVFILLCFLPISHLFGYTPIVLSLLYLMVSSLTFLLYAKDKRAAQNGNWRVSENTLHILSLFSGWPGAIIAQQKLRHKTKKTSFRSVFWLTFLVNSGGLIWIHTSNGSFYFQSYIYKIERVIMHEITSSYARSALLTVLRSREYP